jgi:hypothetical protein
MTGVSEENIDQELKRLTDMNTSDLRAEWRKRFGCKPASRLSKDLMVRTIAYKIQEKVFGGLSKAARKKLKNYRRQIQTGGTIAVATDIRIKPGTKLVREWNGQVHTVVALDKGFEYQGQQFVSLTKIANEITGSHWSGPRFFGLKKRPALVRRRKAAHG